MRAINQSITASFVNFDPIQLFPKPVHKPHPPIFFGGDTPLARQRVVDNYDGWIPTIMRTADFLAGIEHIRTPGLRAWARPEIDRNLHGLAAPRSQDSGPL